MSLSDSQKLDIEHEDDLTLVAPRSRLRAPILVEEPDHRKTTGHHLSSLAAHGSASLLSGRGDHILRVESSGPQAAFINQTTADVDRAGAVRARFAPTTKPERLARYVAELL